VKFQKDRYAQRGIFPSKQHGETEENEENTIMALDGGGRQKKVNQNILGGKNVQKIN
jgi:hypothetical protein